MELRMAAEQDRLLEVLTWSQSKMWLSSPIIIAKGSDE
jgi:hypothetical protein